MPAVPQASGSTSRFRFQNFLHDGRQDPPKPSASGSSNGLQLATTQLDDWSWHFPPPESAIVALPLSMVALLRDRSDYEYYLFGG
jgi:hypothetical protein